MKQIELIVQRNGQTRVETKGFAGASCREASRFLEQTLGRTGRETLTTEFHQSAVQDQQMEQH